MALPQDVVHAIMQRLDITSLQSAAMMCKGWYTAYKEQTTCITLCSRTPRSYATLYPALQKAVICDPGLSSPGCTSGDRQYMLTLCTDLGVINNLRYATAPAFACAPCSSPQLRRHEHAVMDDKY